MASQTASLQDVAEQDSPNAGRLALGDRRAEASPATAGRQPSFPAPIPRCATSGKRQSGVCGAAERTIPRAPCPLGHEPRRGLGSQHDLPAPVAVGRPAVARPPAAGG